MSVGIRRPAGTPTSAKAVGSVDTSNVARESPGMTSTRYWNRLAQDVPDASIVARHAGVVVTEREFRQRIAAWRAILHPIPETAIALYEPLGTEFAAALFGAWYAGKAVFLPGDVQADTCRALLGRNAKLVGAFPPEFDALSITTAADSSDTFDPLDADTATVIIFTSGSTGEPQAVPKRLSQLLAEVDTLERLFGTSLRGDVLATVSHQHIYGLLFKVLWPLATFRVFVSESLVYPEQLRAFVVERDAVVVSGPAHLKRLPETLDWSEAPAHISRVFSSGGPLTIDAVVLAEQLFGTAPVEVYGSSETGGVAWRQRTAGVEAPWTAMPNVEVRAEDGRLAVRSPHLATLDWLLVEDHAQFDVEGRFVLLGRADRLAKIEGKRISLAAMETALLRTNLVAEVRLVQLESARDAIGALVVPGSDGWSVLREHGSSSLRRQLAASLNAGVERIAHPRSWRWVDALPVNADGKTTDAIARAAFHPSALTVPALHVLASSGTEVELELYVSPGLPVFDGHFREIPVLPGVAQLDWAMLFGRRLFGMSLSFIRMEAVKFHRVYQPGPLLRLQLHWHPDRRMLAFRYDSVNSTHSSGRIFFEG